MTLLMPSGEIGGEEDHTGPSMNFAGWFYLAFESELAGVGVEERETGGGGIVFAGNDEGYFRCGWFVADLVDQDMGGGRR